MTDYDNEREVTGRQVPDHDELDREIDAALSKFVSVEPREGLEQRVLANLRAGQQLSAKASWWRWPAVAALAVVVIVLAVSAVRRSERPAHDFAVHRSLATAPNVPQPGTQAASQGGSGPIGPYEARSGRRLKPHTVIPPATVAASAAKLDQFPSPQPLSEQEKILESYVTNYPEEAVLIARARAEELRRDAAEEMSDGVPASDKDSQQ